MTERSYFSSAPFFLGFAYNFMIALNFSNNAIYPLYVTGAGGTAETVGMFMGAYSLAAVLGRPLVGYLIDRWSAKLILIIGSSFLTIAPLGYLFLIDDKLGLWVWALRFLHGFGFGAHFSAFFTYAGQSAPKSRRNESVAKYGLSGLAAHMIGPLIGEHLVSTYGLPVFFSVMTVFGGLGVLIALFLPKPTHLEDPSVIQNENGKAAIEWKNLIFIFSLAIFLAISFTSAPAFLAPLAEERSLKGFGLYFTGFSIAGIITRIFGSHLGDTLGLRRVLLPAFLAYAAGLYLISYSYSLWLIIFAGAFCGVAHGLAFPAVVTLGYNLAGRGHAGRATALTTGMMDGGAVLGAFLLGVLAEHYGYTRVFVVSPIAPLFASLIVFISILKNPAPIKAEL
ncbi:MFS transporter [bacterium]|nr:MFS transporter [bacterium]